MITVANLTSQTAKCHVLSLDFLTHSELDHIRDNMEFARKADSIGITGQVLICLYGADRIFAPQHLSTLIDKIREAGSIENCKPAVLDAIITVLDTVGNNAEANTLEDIAEFQRAAEAKKEKKPFWRFFD